MAISKELATLLLRAANLRESSWDEAAYNLAKPLEKKYRDFYRISLYAACQMACETEPNILPVVFGLLESRWNDSIEWAKKETT